ncbi:MAG TPA: UbiD family decarboxylase [candidate division Zixibacteria bacterium]|nr:UbiD family decarboxylase [candidate division Zixibacteria bacterium]
MFNDTRDFIEALRASGDLLEIDKEVHWDLELGAVSRLACEKDGPALWFKRIADYPPAMTALANPMATWRRVAVAFGLRPDATLEEIHSEYEKREGSPIPPRTVKDGPCKENVKLADDADVYDLPAPMLHDGDGGRYLGTWDIVVSYDPETKWVNWGMYRFMVYDSRHLSGFPRPTSHFGKVFQDHYVARNKPMPVALVIGADPISHFTASATYHIGGEEAALAGGLRGAPVELVRCETSDLLVPANAEIVIECEALPDYVGLEGPYGEYPGYRTGEMGNGVLCRVNAITRRENPVLTVDATGYRDDSSTITALTGAVAIKRRLERHGLPVLAVNIPREGAVHAAVIAVRHGGKQVAREILEILTSRRALISKIFLVEADVDVYDIGQVLHAFSTKCHPAHGIHVVHYEGRANTLTPCYSQGERAAQKGATVLYDCTWPGEWSAEWEIPVKATFETIFPRSIREKVLARWKSYGFKE